MVFLIKLVRSGDRHFYFLVLFIICERALHVYLLMVFSKQEKKKQMEDK